MIKFIKLHQRFNSRLLQDDLLRVTGSGWKHHYNTTHYTGEWTVLPLRSINGNADNLYAVHNNAAGALSFRDTPYMECCPYIREVLSFFKCETTTVRLMKLYAGAVIKEHTDMDMCFEDGEVRFHIPVQTNERVSFFVNGEKIPMHEGECWYLNLSLPHEVKNEGDTDRVHLVIDGIVNDWVKQLFTTEQELRKDFEHTPAAEQYDTKTTRAIISELRKQATPASIALADKMESGLK
jgi:hypothetical protein